DQIGLDVAAHVARTPPPDPGGGRGGVPALAGRFEPNTAFERLRSRGWLGQKSGTGFYLHRGKSPQVNAAAQDLLREGAQGGGAAQSLSQAVRLREARERMVLLMVNEAALALGEGLAANAGVIDLALVLGTGWAPHRGGPLRYADDRGPAEVV